MCCAICGCSSDSASTDIRYLPVKLVGSEMWSIIDVTNGKLVYKDEFREQPSPVVNDIFVVKNSLGTFDYYSIDKVKTPINKTPFASAAVFYDDVTVAALPGEPLSIINRKCEVEATLGKSVRNCSYFYKGVAVFTDDASAKKGLIDKNGKTLLKPIYENIVISMDGTLSCIKEGECEVYDKSLNNLFSFNDKAVTFMNDGVMTGMSIDSSKVNYVGNILHIDRNGNTVRTVCEFPQQQAQANIAVLACSYNNGYYAYCDGQLFGLKDKDGNIAVRPKYEVILPVSDGHFVAYKQDKAGLIDHNDNTLIEFEHKAVAPICDGVFAVGDSILQILSTNGKPVSQDKYIDVSMSLCYMSRGIGMNEQINGIAKSNYIDITEKAEDFRQNFKTNIEDYYTKTKTADDFQYTFRHPASYYTYETESEDLMGKTLLFDRKIVEDSYSYYGSYKFYNGKQFSRSAKLIGVRSKDSQFSLAEYPSDTEDKVVAELEKIFKTEGYTSDGDNILHSPDGRYISIGYQEGNLVIHYFFDKEKMTPAPREPR